MDCYFEKNLEYQMVLTALQAFIHLEKCSSNLIKCNANNLFVGGLQGIIRMYNNDKLAIRDDFFIEVQLKNEENLKKISKSSKIIEKLFEVLNKLTKEKNCAWNPIDHVFKLNKELFLIEGNQPTPLNNLSKYILNAEFSKDLIQSNQSKFVSSIKWPLTLCLDSTKIMRFDQVAQNINLNEGNPYYQVDYTLELILIKRKDKILIYVKNNQKNWICKSYFRDATCLDEAFNEPTNRRKYLFYERKPFSNKISAYQNFTNLVWMNFYLSDEIYSSFIKLKKPKALWINEIKKNFLESEKKRNKDIDSHKQNSEPNHNQSVELDNKFFVKLNQLSNISNLFFNHSDLAYISENFDNFEVLRSFIEEVHSFKIGHETLCDCPFCENIVYKNYDNPQLKNEYITSLELGDQDIFTYVDSVKNDFLETILENTDLNKFRGKIEASYFIKFMELKLLTNFKNQKCKAKYNYFLIYHMKSSIISGKDYLHGITEIIFYELKNENYNYILDSIIFVYDNKNCCLIKEKEKCWNVIIPINNSIKEKVFKNISDALKEVKFSTSSFDIFLFYEKSTRPSLKTNSNPEGGIGTQPLRLENTNDQKLCYINSAIQSIFNIYSFKQDISKWKPKIENEWQNQLINLFNNEIKRDEQGKKIYELGPFRKKFIEDTKYIESSDGLGNSIKFLKQLLDSIHEKSYCDNNRKCPACENFLIKGKLETKNKHPYYLSHFINYKGIRLKGDVLSVCGKNQNHFDLPNPPLCLFYELKCNGSDSNMKAENFKDFIIGNQSFDYINKGITYHYELKSVILYGGSHFKSLLYSRTYNCWTLMNDSDIEPLYLKLEDYQIKEGGFLPEGLIYYRVIPNETIRDYISTLYISLCTTQAFTTAYEEVDTMAKNLKDTFTFLKSFSERIIENLEMKEFSSNYIDSFKRKGEIRNIKDSFFNFLKLFHENEKNDPNNTTKCYCLACKIFCCQILEINDGYQKLKKKLKVSVDVKNVGLQYNIFEKKFDCKAFCIKSSKSITVMKTPLLLPIQLKPLSEDLNQESLYSLLDNNRILYINEPLAVYFLHSIMFSSPSNFDTISYIETSTGGKAYENGCLISNSITIREIFNKGYHPTIAFYEKQNINYITAAISTLNHLTTFKKSIINYNEIGGKWFMMLKGLFINNERLKNSKEIWAFKDIFNENTEDKISDLALEKYNIEQTIKLILNRIHIESYCIDKSCPVCLNFLIEGTCRRIDRDESYSFFITRLTNSFGPKMHEDIGQNVLSYIYDKRPVPIIYELFKLPQILYYICLYDKIGNLKHSDIQKICKNSLKDKITVVCTKDQTPRNYILKCVIFSIKNGYDIYRIAVKDSNSAWRLDGSDKTIKTAPEIIDKAEEFFGRPDFYPSELFYQLC